MADRILVSMQEGLTEPEWISKVKDFLQSVMDRLGMDGEEVSVLFCDDSFIRGLNNTYRNIDAPTDVLSFESGEKYEDEEGSWINAGDIVISLDTLPKNSEYFDVPPDTELKRLIIHGLLHLNGYDHGDEHIEKGVKPVCRMLEIQEKILEEFSDTVIMNYR